MCMFLPYTRVLLIIFKFQNLTEDDPLNTILSDMGSAKTQLPYLEDISITLTLQSRWEQVPGKCMKYFVYKDSHSSWKKLDFSTKLVSVQ